MHQFVITVSDGNDTSVSYVQNEYEAVRTIMFFAREAALNYGGRIVVDQLAGTAYVTLPNGRFMIGRILINN